MENFFATKGSNIQAAGKTRKIACGLRRELKECAPTSTSNSANGGGVGILSHSRGSRQPSLRSCGGALKLTDSGQRARRLHLPAHAGGPQAGPSLAHPGAREPGSRRPGGQIRGPLVLRRRVRTIKGAIESERGEGWKKGDRCRSSPPPAQLYSLGLWSGRRRGSGRGAWG